MRAKNFFRGKKIFFLPKKKTIKAQKKNLHLKKKNYYPKKCVLYFVGSRISNKVNMCDCYSSSSDDDFERKNVVADRSCSLVPPNLALYETCGDIKQIELGVQLAQFDNSKLSVVADKETTNNFNIFYDGQKFCLFLKAFPAIVERSKYFAREKHIKLKDHCQSKLLWEVLWNIAEKVMEAVAKEDKFCWFIDWYRIWITTLRRPLLR